MNGPYTPILSCYFIILILIESWIKTCESPKRYPIGILSFHNPTNHMTFFPTRFIRMIAAKFWALCQKHLCCALKPRTTGPPKGLFSEIIRNVLANLGRSVKTVVRYLECSFGSTYQRPYKMKILVFSTQYDV